MKRTAKTRSRNPCHEKERAKTVPDPGKLKTGAAACPPDAPASGDSPIGFSLSAGMNRGAPNNLRSRILGLLRHAAPPFPPHGVIATLNNRGIPPEYRSPRSTELRDFAK